MGIGCGYVALAGLAHRDPAEVRRIGRERLGIRRPIGLYDFELMSLARVLGFEARSSTFRDQDRPTLAAFMRAAKPGRYALLSCNHWVGVFKGLDGSLAYFNSLGRKSSRMRVRCAVSIVKVPPVGA